MIRTKQKGTLVATILYHSTRQMKDFLVAFAQLGYAEEANHPPASTKAPVHQSMHTCTTFVQHIVSTESSLLWVRGSLFITGQGIGAVEAPADLHGGRFVVQLFDMATGRWELVEVDDFVPCTMEES